MYKIGSKVKAYDVTNKLLDGTVVEILGGNKYMIAFDGWGFKHNEAVHIMCIRSLNIFNDGDIWVDTNIDSDSDTNYYHNTYR